MTVASPSRKPKSSTPKASSATIVSLEQHRHEEAAPTHIVCRNPATEEFLGEVPCTPLENLPEYFAEARKAQKIWASLSFQQRCTHMLKIRDYMIEHSEEIARVIAQSTGKTLSDAFVGEVMSSIVGTDWYGKKAAKLLKRKRLPPSNVLFANKQSYIDRHPWGVVGIISPWNYPFGIPFSEIIMGLMAGNAVFYKTAEETALVGLEIEKILKAGNLPKGLTQFFIGVPAQISSSWLQNGIDKLFFTGSVRVGKLLMRQAAENLIPLSLELGGNDAMIVLEDANLERAANGAVWAGFQNGGQTCAGVERVYVQETVADKFIHLLKIKTEKLRQGVDREEFDIDVGAMTVARQKSVVERHVEDALSKGARIIAQAKVLDQGPQHKNFYPATVLVNVDHTMDVMREETFGPVIAVMSFKTEEEALTLANDSDLGLTSSVWTQNNERGKRLASKLETGITTINDHVYTHAMSELPWIGWKNSGLGSTHSHMGLEEMTRPKVVSYDLAPQINANLWWFPHRRIKHEIFKETLQLLFGKSLNEKSQALLRLAPKILSDPLLKEKASYVLDRVRYRGGKQLKKTLATLEREDD